MVQKVAVLLVHGMERSTTEDLSLEASKKAMIEGLSHLFHAQVPEIAPDKALAFQMALWPIPTGIQVKTLDFIQTMLEAGLNVGVLRQLVLQLLVTGVMYQSSAQDREMYQAIHSVFAQSLHTLAHQAGEKAPLIIVAHSIGAVMIANYLYDLQHHTEDHPLIPVSVQRLMHVAPLEQGETLSHLFTLGSPQALWAMRLERFGSPVSVPAPKLHTHYPHLDGQWMNMYDKDDVLSYPLQPLNEEFNRAVKDVEVNVGSLLERWNPASHLAYWDNKAVLQPIGAALAQVWRGVNG